jgi:hypothetical protein
MDPFGDRIVAMSFREHLAGGRHGVRASLPGLVDWQGDEKTARAADRDRGVLWRFAVSPWSVDLREEHDEALRPDIERQARHDFEAAFTPIEWPPGSGAKRPPRTDDPAWSPVVEIDRTSIGGAAALRIVDRLTYQPGNEIVVGRLQIPLRRGSFHVGAYARAGTTGFRESALMVAAGKDEDGRPRFLTQQEYDDPKHDDAFPDSPLSRVRAALRWLVDPEGGALAVTQPMPELAGDEVILERHGCAILPPPRYVLVPEDVMSTNMSVFVRTLLSDESYRMVDATHYTRDLGLGEIETDEDLVQLAEEDARSWAREGVTEIKTQARVLERDDGRIHVLCHIRFRIGEKEKRTAARWVLDSDGWIFRACASGPRYLPKKDLAADAEAVVRSLRRLTPPESGRRGPRKKGGGGEVKKAEAVKAQAKKWWKLW